MPHRGSPHVMRSASCGAGARRPGVWTSLVKNALTHKWTGNAGLGYGLDRTARAAHRGARRRYLENRVASLQVSPHRSFARWHAALVLVLSLALGACSTTTFQQQVVAPVAPQSFTSTSTKYAAIVIDGSNGRVLYQSSAEALRYPASLTKMMTLYLLFEAMESGRVSRDDADPGVRLRPLAAADQDRLQAGRQHRCRDRRSWRW